MPNTNPPPPDEPKLTFLGRAYWILGSFAVIWSIATLNGVLQRQPFTIPIFGKVQPVQAIIFTQGAFCLLLPLLLGVIATFRGETSRRGRPIRFPGVVGKDWNVPDAFARLRVAIFLGLVALPVVTMQFCYRRMVCKLEIHSINDATQPPLRRGVMFRFAQAQRTGGGRHDWRWRGEDIALSGGELPAHITAFPFWQPWIYRVRRHGHVSA